MELNGPASQEYVYEVMQGLASKCAESSVLECDLWLQKGDGMHQSVELYCSLPESPVVLIQGLQIYYNGP